MRQDFSDITAEHLSLLFPIKLEPHDPEWETCYEQESLFLKSVFGDKIVRMSPIGSSSVPGLIAKPTVDILLEIKENTDMTVMTEAMKDAGYVVNTPKQDIILYLKGYTPHGFDGQCFHIHVRYAGDWDELYFRDYLQAHPDVAQAYGKLKQQLKEQYLHDRDGYTNAKGDFIKEYTLCARREFPGRYEPAERNAIGTDASQESLSGLETSDLEMQRFYNDIAHEFADAWYANECLLPVLKAFLTMLKPHPRVLDLGCGAGYESMRLHRLGAEVVGIDYSAEPIQIARERNPQCRFEVMDIRKLGISLGRFDGILAAASLIHIRDEELATVFGEMHKVLHERGYALVLLVEGHGLSMERSKIERDGTVYHRPFYLHSRERLNEVRDKTGFKHVEEWPLPEELASFGWKCFLFQGEPS